MINQELNGRCNVAGYITGKQRYDTIFIVAKAGYDIVCLYIVIAAVIVEIEYFIRVSVGEGSVNIKVSFERF